MEEFIKKFTPYERILWLHQELKKNRYPKTKDLAERFELSERSAQRVVTFMRDRMQAPLEYSRLRGGYFYSKEDYELPLAQVSQEEILAVLLARNLLSDSAEGLISRQIQSFSRKLMARTAQCGLSEDKIAKAFSAVWNGYSPALALVFQTVSQALLTEHALFFSYTSPANKPQNQRTVLPHHLQHYMGSWVLLAYCEQRQDWRKFYLSRMQKVRILDKTFTPRSWQEWAFQIQDSFGIFQGQESTTVILGFTPFRARWIREQVWHPEQKLRELPGGGLELEIPVADFREIKMRILSFGADVKVVSPETLRLEVAEEIRRMQGLYPNLLKKN
jgi:predicted DNA-binding transcriptional regulator YafY